MKYLLFCALICAELVPESYLSKWPEAEKCPRSGKISFVTWYRVLLREQTHAGVVPTLIECYTSLLSEKPLCRIKGSKRTHFQLARFRFSTIARKIGTQSARGCGSRPLL